MRRRERDARPSVEPPSSSHGQPQVEQIPGAPTGNAEGSWLLPLGCSPACGWDAISLQRLRHSSGRIDIPARPTDVLVGHMGGPFLAEADPGTRRYERTWVRAGHFGVNPAGAPVRREIKGRSDVVLVHIPPAKLRAIAAEMFEVDPARVELVPVLAASDETAHRFMTLFLGEAISPAPGSPLMVQSLTRAFMVHVLRHYSNLAIRHPDRTDSLSPGRVRRVLDHMRDNLDQPLSLADLARTAGVSPSHFVRAFHEAMGQPPHRFLIRLRTERACQLLQSTGLPITEIALQCGFDQPSHFAATFRKLLGVTPGTWRRERRA